MLGAISGDKKGVIWSAIVVAIILVLLLAVYLIVTLRHFHLVRKEDKAKIEYNKLTNESDLKNFNYLETLAKKNVQLQKIIKLILEINKFYKQQLDELQLKLIDLSIVNERYQLTRAAKLIKEINNDIYCCKQLSVMIQTIYTNSTDYSVSVSSILAKYRIVYTDIKEFYLNYLAENFKQKKFIEAVNRISDEITKADLFQAELNNEKLVKTMNIINELNKAFLVLVKLSYTYSNVINYVQDTKKQLDDNILRNYKKVSKKEHSEAQRVSSHVKELTKVLSKHLEDLNFDLAKITTKTISSQLEPALNTFKDYDRISLLIESGLNFASVSLNVIDTNIKELDKAFESICKYFGNDNNEEMIVETDLLKSSFKKIKINFLELEARSKNTEHLDHINFLKELFGLVNNIGSWEKSLNDLYKKIVHKYQSTIHLLDKIYEMRWTLAQFVALINAKVINVDEPTIVIVDSHLKTIDLLIAKLHENFSHNYNTAYETVMIMEKDVSNIYTIVDIEAKLKDYAKALIFYTNKFRLEAKEIEFNLNKAEELYKQCQYRRVLDILIPILKHIKKSAKANGYVFK